MISRYSGYLTLGFQHPSFAKEQKSSVDVIRSSGFCSWFWSSSAGWSVRGTNMCERDTDPSRLRMFQSHFSWGSSTSSRVLFRQMIALLLMVFWRNTGGRLRNALLLFKLHDCAASNLSLDPKWISGACSGGEWFGVVDPEYVCTEAESRNSLERGMMFL